MRKLALLLFASVIATPAAHAGPYVVLSSPIEQTPRRELEALPAGVLVCNLWGECDSSQPSLLVRLTLDLAELQPRLERHDLAALPGRTVADAAESTW